MTTRTLAATAAALPLDMPAEVLDRRSVLASAGAAAVLAAIGAPTLASLDPDAELLALRPGWIAAQALLELALDEHDAALMRMYALPGWNKSRSDPELRGQVQKETGVDKTEARQDRANDVDDTIVREIAAMPARTLAGLAFKVEVSSTWEHDHKALTPSIMADVVAFAAAHPTMRL